MSLLDGMLLDPAVYHVWIACAYGKLLGSASR